MKFLCIGYLNQEKMGTLPKESIDVVMSECEPHMKVFHGTGKVLLDVGVESEAIYIRRVQGEVISFTDSNTSQKQHVGGVQIIEANDLEEAIQIAKLHPTTQVASGEQLGWTMEIRPIYFFEGALTKK
jgi:hypothetical protein